MTELVDEERPRVEVFDSVSLPPRKCVLPRTVRFRRQREGGRPQPQHVHQQRFIVSLVSIADKAVLWYAAVYDRDIFDGPGWPAVCIAWNAIERPLPVGSAIERVGGFADL